MMAGMITDEKLQHFILQEDIGIEPTLHRAENGDWFFYCHSDDLGHYAKLIEQHPQIETTDVSLVDYRVHRITLRFRFVPRIDYFGAPPVSEATDAAQLAAYGRERRTE